MTAPTRSRRTSAPLRAHAGLQPDGTYIDHDGHRWNDATDGMAFDAGDDHFDAHLDAQRQAASAIQMLDRPADAYLRWPWPTLDAMTGGMAPGDVQFVVAFSGVGKTTLIASAIREWFAQGKRIMVLPLETRPKTFRVHLACLELGLKPGHVLSGDIHRDPDAKQQIDRIKAHIRWQVEGDFCERVRIKGVPFIGESELESCLREAKNMGTDVVIVDHIDHIDGDDESLYQASVRVNKAALRLAHLYEPGVLLFTSQANQEAMKGGRDHLAHYQPPQPNHVLMGNTKRQVATGMIGVYRPIRARKPDETPEEYAAAIKASRAGTEEPWKALEPGVMGVNQMKSRNGKVEGARCQLRVEAGRVMEIPEKDQHATARGAAGRFR